MKFKSKYRYKNKEDNNLNSQSNNFQNNDDEMQDYAEKLSESLANIEKVSVIILIMGYAGYIHASDLDILEAREENNTGELPETAFINSQRLVVLGYTLLFIVATIRIKSEMLNNKYRDEDNDINGYNLVAYSYFISVIANLIRFEAFINIERAVINNTINKNKEDE